MFDDYVISIITQYVPYNHWNKVILIFGRDYLIPFTKISIDRLSEVGRENYMMVNKELRLNRVIKTLLYMIHDVLLGNTKNMDPISFIIIANQYTDPENASLKCDDILEKSKTLGINFCQDILNLPTWQANIVDRYISLNYVHGFDDNRMYNTNRALFDHLVTNHLQGMVSYKRFMVGVIYIYPYSEIVFETMAKKYAEIKSYVPVFVAGRADLNYSSAMTDIDDVCKDVFKRGDGFYNDYRSEFDTLWKKWNNFRNELRKQKIMENHRKMLADI